MYPRVHGVVSQQGNDWAAVTNAVADRYGCPPRLLVATHIMESDLDEHSERRGAWPDVSAGIDHQAVAWAPVGDQRTGPTWRNEVRNYAANIEGVFRLLQTDVALAIEIAGRQLAHWWALHQDGQEALSRYNAGAAVAWVTPHAARPLADTTWDVAWAQNPNRANIQRAWEASARYVVEEVPVAEYAFPIVGYRGPVNNHWGTSERGGSDIFAAKGTPLVVMRGGKVTYAGHDPVGGWNVVIVGDDGLTYYYAHLATKPYVYTGNRVGTGAALGTVGDSGNAAGTGAHLHIGIGYGIRSGRGPGGGCGIHYDAVGLLQRVLAGGAEEDPAVIAELETALAELKAKYDDLNNYTSSLTADTITPTVAEMDGLVQAVEAVGVERVRVWADRLRPHIVEG